MEYPLVSFGIPPSFNGVGSRAAWEDFDSFEHTVRVCVSISECVSVCVCVCASVRSVWQRFCRGLEEFQALAQQRRALRRAARGEQLLPPSAVGVESLIVGVATYELKTL